jgi:ATP phosphoribosyltransferase
MDSETVPTALRIGIPNRSSLLHPLGVVHCVFADLLPAEEYDPARLQYCSGRAEIVLTRCNELCGLFDRGAVDIMLNGGDYVAEHLIGPFGQRIECEVNAVQFAVLVDGRQDAGPRLQTVFTKFPRVARRYLSEWELTWETMVPVSGGVEAFCLLEPRSAAFDIICTGRTVHANGLRVVEKSEVIYPGWYARKTLPRELVASCTDAGLAQRLKTYYQDYLVGRDRVLSDAMRAIVGLD